MFAVVFVGSKSGAKSWRHRIYTLPPRHGGGTSVTLSSSLVVFFFKAPTVPTPQKMVEWLCFAIFVCGFGGFGELIIDSSLLTTVVCKTQSCLFWMAKKVVSNYSS